MGPAEPVARGRARLPDFLARALGAPEGIVLETRVERGAGQDLAVLRPDGSPRLLIPVEISRQGESARSLAMLRILPLSLVADAPRGSPLALAGRWRQEWMDLASPARGREAGVPRAHAACAALPRHAPVLPPAYYCRIRQVWIVAVCPGCGGPADQEVGAGTCPSCGSPAPADLGGRPVPEAPLRAIWERVHGRASSDGLDPACVSCDQRSSCFPPGGSGEAAGKAVEALQPVSEGAWGGALLEPAHLPLDAWFLLASGTPWVEVRERLGTVPEAILEEADAFLLNERAFLTSPAAKEPFGLESLLLRLETLRQLLEGLRTIATDMDHPHLGLSAEAVWVRLEAPGNLRSALWAARLVFLDPAPAWVPDRRGFAPPPGRVPFLTPAGCDREDEPVEGLCIPRAAGAGGGEQGAVGIDFLPQSPLSRPPSKGDAVVLGLPAPRTGEGRFLSGRVEIGFPEVCRLLVSDPAVSPAEIRRLLTGSSVALRMQRDHSLVDDLFAAGTLFLSSLLRHAGDVAEAARFRDELAPRLQGAGGADAGETECLRAVVSSGLFPVQGEAAPVQSGTAPAGDAAMLDRALAAKAVALAMRLCAAIPAAYPGQRHEPVGREERARGYESLLSMLTAFSREVRERFLATAETGDAALAALGAYALERLKAPQPRQPGGGRGAGAAKKLESR